MTLILLAMHLLLTDFIISYLYNKKSLLSVLRLALPLYALWKCKKVCIKSCYIQIVFGNKNICLSCVLRIVLPTYLSLFVPKPQKTFRTSVKEICLLLCKQTKCFLGVRIYNYGMILRNESFSFSNCIFPVKV